MQVVIRFFGAPKEDVQIDQGILCHGVLNL
jgi:hypothetical protein